MLSIIYRPADQTIIMNDFNITLKNQLLKVMKLVSLRTSTFFAGHYV